MADTIIIGSPEFEVDLQAMADAVTTCRADAADVKADFDGIRNQFAYIMTIWLGPAGGTFAELATDLIQRTNAMESLLDDMVGRMQTAHDNYYQAEQQNQSNFDNVQRNLSGDPNGSGNDPQPAAEPDARKDVDPGTRTAVVEPTATLAMPTGRTQPVVAAVALDARQPSS